MRKNLDADARNSLESATTAIRAYAGSDVSKHAIDLFDSLATAYCLELMHVAPECLHRVQAALQQVSALRDVFADESIDVPKI